MGSCESWSGRLKVAVLVGEAMLLRINNDPLPGGFLPGLSVSTMYGYGANTDNCGQYFMNIHVYKQGLRKFFRSDRLIHLFFFEE